MQRLRDIAGTQDLRDELIRTSVKDVSAIVEVVKQLGAVGAEDKETAAATRTLARIYLQAGGLMENLGRYNEAILCYRQMDELAELLAAANPGQIDAKKPLASSKITIGEFEMNRLGDSKRRSPGRTPATTRSSATCSCRTTSSARFTCSKAKTWRRRELSSKRRWLSSSIGSRPSRRTSWPWETSPRPIITSRRRPSAWATAPPLPFTTRHA